MRQVLFKKGKVVVEEVPAPVCGEKEVLVENYYSLISSGTELSSLNFSSQSLPFKILKYPAKVTKGLRLVKEHGLKDAYKIVTGMLEAGATPGYSSCGKIVEAGKKISDLKIGEMVACAGANIASHAEFIAVPRNLVVKLPKEVVLEEAASTTIGSIALQGVRQADLKIEESAAVIGLGLLGQLTSQILLANGVKTIGIEISKGRINLAKKNGLKHFFSPFDKNLLNEINALTDFQGVDATIITASNPNDSAIINQALMMTRKRGKVVVVGDVGLKIERLPWYEKEIDLRISTSYGPGRGDIKYEHEGIDYPYAYVRWTENRNMQAYLELLAEKKINFSSLVGGRYSLEDAALAYEALNSSKKPLAVLLSYPASILEDKKAETFIYLPSIDQRKDIIDGKIETGIIGLGSFAQVVHLPNLLKLKNLFHLRGICTSDQVKAKYFGKKYQAEIAATDYKEILKDPKINLVIITTRHNLHAQIVKDALMAGKNVFVEKPLCLNMAELEEILATLKEVNKNGNYPVLAVGFNRRFSPLIKKAKEIISGRRNPLLIYYRVNDTYLPPNHWVNTAEGGGRILGNACHLFDLFQYFIGSPVEEVKVLTIETEGTFYLPTDNFSVLLKFKDGSIANLLYTTEGSEKLPKEYFEIYSEGRVLILNDFKELKTFGLRDGMKTRRTAKGHFEELKILGECLKKKKWPIPLEEIIETTKISFEVDRQARRKEL